MVFQDAGTRGQAETVPLRLGRQVLLEQPFFDIRGHTPAVIRDR